MRYLHLAVLAVFSVCLSVSQYSFASNVVATSGQSIYKSPVTSEDVLTLNPANASGISFNYFDSFLVKDKVLKLVNTPVNNGAGYTDAAMLIVVISDNITIENRIELLGPATDILFLSRKDNGQLTCNSCSFDNFYRITLAAASTESTFPTSNGLIGELTTTPNGSISINNLTAAGSLAVETLADSVTLNGTLDTHDRAESEGFMNGYAQNQNGDYTIGTGSVNLMMGQMKWNYDAQTITKITPSYSDQVLGGAINSVEVRVSSSDSLTLNTKIDTRVDLLATTQYKGVAFLPVESINVQDFSNRITAINNALISEGLIAASSRGSINLAAANSSIKAERVRFIALNKFFNESLIASKLVEIDAGRVVNRHKIQAEDKVVILAGSHIINEFGGEILSDTVVLESASSIVRNGSRTPYVVEPSSNLLLVNVNDNTPQMTAGTFYNAKVDANSSQELKANKTNAYITGNNISIKGAAFENLNPYWETSQNGKFILNAEFVSQVIVSAEDALVIDLTSYLLNSSATLQVSDAEGSMNINAPRINNERYRILNLLDKEIVENSDSSYTNQEEIYKSTTVAYSPPGRLISIGDLTITDPSDTSSSNYLYNAGMLNDRSYVEVYGNAYLETYQVNNIGSEHSGMKNWVINIDQSLSECYSKYLGESWSIPYCLHYYWDLVAKENPDFNFGELNLFAVDSAEQDSLFYVGGKTYGSTSKTKLSTEVKDVFSYFESKAVNEAVKEVRREHSSADPGLTVVSFGTEILRDPEGDAITINWKREQRVFYDFMGLPTYHDTTVTGSEEFSLLEQIKKLYESLLEVLTELLNEVKWW